MEQTIIDIIDKKAMRQYRGMTEIKKKAYRAMLYAGAQIILNGFSIRDIAKEIDYSESGTSKLVQKWIELRKNGDITINLITAAIVRLPKTVRFQRSKQDSKLITANPMPEHPEEVNKPIPVTMSATNPNQKEKKILGFKITTEDEMRIRAAIRSSILFFQTFGNGSQPRLKGEYFAPGTNPDETVVDDGKWLPLETASHYCGCKEEDISHAGQSGIIERRVYHSTSNRNYYEYKLEDLDRYIRVNNLL